MIHTAQRQQIANITAIISLVAVYGALFIFGVILQMTPPKWLCNILGWGGLITCIISFIILPKDTKDMSWTALSFLSGAASLVYIGMTF